MSTLCALALVLSVHAGAPAIPQAATPEPASETPEPARESIVPRDWLVLAPVDGRGRRPFRPDAVFARHVFERGSPPPKAGQTIAGELGEASWEPFEADADGKLGGRIGYAYTRVESDTERVVLARLSGAWQLFVNGVVFTGDAYGYGFDGVPVVLNEGANDVYVTGVRGSFQLRFVEPDGPVVAGAWDVTRPDLLRRSKTTDAEMQLPVWNATQERMTTAELVLGGPALDRPTTVKTLRPIWPLALDGARTWIGEKGWIALRETELDGRASIEVAVRSSKGAPLGTAHAIEFVFADPGAARRGVHASGIDGSLQSHALIEPRAPMPGQDRVVLTLHGAGVVELRQARCYAPKQDFWILAPTNRRPFGFDWQDWGRRDAYEALESAVPGARQVFLTGHSMGGHGVWHLAANDPDRFAAIAPSAGWQSFDTYGGRPDGELAELWHAADGASRSATLIDNLRQIPTFILHGADDTTVPVDEARAMQALLEEAGAHPRTHYQEGAGHWWNGEASAGTDCVDWPGIFELFASIKPRSLSPMQLDFTTIDPAIDAQHHWVRVDQPLVYGRPARVTARFDSELGGPAITTENVRRLYVLAFHNAPRRIDGDTLDATSSKGGYLRTPDGWTVAETSADAAPEKKPPSSGPLKRAFDRRFLLVFGTAGNAEEDRELFEQARADQQAWWYRANGAPLLIADTQLVDPNQMPALAGRNVILYGNADTNAAWRVVLGEDLPLDVRRGALRLGQQTFEGDDLGAVFIHPRVDEHTRGNVVGVFASTGPRAARIAPTLAPFVSGVGYPDYAVFSSRVLTEGDGGVLAAGWFGPSWALQTEDAFLRGE